MKFKSALVTQISGSVGGMTGSHNRGGMYFRARSVPVNPNSVLQQARRQIFALLSQFWSNDMSDAERAEWAGYSAATPIPDKLGEPRDIGGLPMFNKVNSLVKLAGLAIKSSAPVGGGLDITGVPELGFGLNDGTGITATIDDEPTWAGEDGGRILLFLSPAVSSATNFYKGPFRFAGAVAGNTSTPVTSAVVAANASPYPLVQGNRHFVRAVGFNADGKPCSEVIYPAVVTSSEEQ